MLSRGSKIAIIVFILYTYNLRPRRHSFSSTSNTDRRSFVNRLLYKDTY